jgi:hypothetical protein
MFYIELFRTLEQEKVRYLLVGGLAVNLHGIARFTADVDIMLALDAENLGRFIAAAKRLKLKPVVPVTLDDFADPAKVQGWIDDKHMLAFALRSPERWVPTLDILVKPAVAFEAAFDRQVSTTAEGVPVRLAAVEDIIKLKTGTGRQKDEADINALQQLLRVRDSRK